MLRWCIVAAVLFAASDARAYEFWLDARTIGQAYQLREYRLLGPDLFLGRREVTQTLALRIFDVGDFARRRRIERLPDHGLLITWQSYLRIDHDFGDYTMGRIVLPGPMIRDAIDEIPELADSAAALDLMYGYLQLDGMWDDRVRLRLGRILIDDGWGEGAFDGAAARVRVAEPVTVQASVGLRVRASSPLGVSSYELDGTSGAGCREYVAGPTPGTGSWQLIDRNRDVTNHALSSDYAYCPQRDEQQPTVGVTIATAGTRRFGAQLGYRRTWSNTVGLIGPAQGVDQTPSPLYPDEYGQAPGTGVNEERIYARVHGRVRAGGFLIEPYADARFSLVEALFDRADAGVRVTRGKHVLEPTVAYFYPTFDSDSIFNAFSIDPTTDVRLAYEYAPAGAWRGDAEAWVRHYGHEAGQPSLAGGVDAGVEHVRGTWRGRIDGLWDDGFGGRRIGGSAGAAWHARSDLWLRGREIVLGVREDALSLGRRYVTTSTQVSTTYRVAEFVAVHVIAEADYDAVHSLQTRVIGVLDLAFKPEP